MTSESTAVAKNQEEEKEQEECQSEALPVPENLQKGLFFMERILMENIFQPKLAAYRQFPILIGLILIDYPVFSTGLCMLLSQSPVPHPVSLQTSHLRSRQRKGEFRRWQTTL